MKFPSYLQKGDVVAIACPSGHMPEERVFFARKCLEHWGFEVWTGPNVGHGEYYFSGTDTERLRELQYFMDHPKVKAILMGRGGYGLSRIIDSLNFDAFGLFPKWICGFSDITVLHAHLQSVAGFGSLHSAMCGAFLADNWEAPHIVSLYRALCGEPFLDIRYPCHPYNRTGEADGELVGGNLAILAHLTGSVSQLDTRGKILFLEDVGEYLYNIDRMMLNLKRAGLLKGLAGLVCGGFSELKDTTRPLGIGVYEIIAQHVSEYDYPISFGLPCGHEEVNFTLQLGKKYHLLVKSDESHFYPEN